MAVTPVGDPIPAAPASVGSRRRGPRHLDAVGSKSPRTVLVVDDHELLRAGTRQILEQADGFDVIGEAADGGTAVRLVRELGPDVVLVDIRLPDGNGIDVARRILALEAPPIVLVLSAYDDEHYVRAALAAGVSGYLLKTIPADELVRLVWAACDDPVNVVNVPSPRGSPSLGHQWADVSLTARERDVVRLAVRGLANKQIARQLRISPRTVEGHLNHIFEKVHAGSRTELVHYALSHGLFPTGSAGRTDPSRHSE
ncbi:MAG: response regulator transcription factor [Acidimicrobiales bacterium]